MSSSKEKEKKQSKTASNNADKKNKKVLPFIPTRDVIVLEGIVDYLEIGRPKSKESINMSMKGFGSQIVLLPQKNADQRDVKTTSDLQKYGVLAKIIKIEEIGSNKRVTVEGIKKVEILEFEDNSDAYVGTFADAKPITKYKSSEKTDIKLQKLHTTLYTDFVGSNDQFKKIFIKSPIPYFTVEQIAELINMNKIISSFAIPIKFTYFYFNQKTMAGKLDVLWTIIDELSEGLKTDKSIDNEIENELKKSLDKQNKEFILREKLKVTRNLLCEDTQ